MQTPAMSTAHTYFRTLTITALLSLLITEGRAQRTFNSGEVARLVGSNYTVAGIDSATPGAGLIENNHGIRSAILTINPSSGVFTYSGDIRDSSTGPQEFAKLSFHKDGAGTQVLAGATKTYTGGTVVWDGTLTMGATNVLPVGERVVLGGNPTSSAVWDLAGYDQQIGNLSSGMGGTSTIKLAGATLKVSGSSGNPGDGNYLGPITGVGNLVKTGTNILSLGGANTYAGSTVVESGTLIAAHASAFGNSTVTLKSGAKLGIAINSLATSIIAESGEVILDPRGSSRIYSGNLSGDATLHISGDLGSSLKLTGTNTYTGETKVTNSSLVLSADSQLGASNRSIILNNAALIWDQPFTLSPTRAIILAGNASIGANYSNYATTLTHNISGPGSLSLTSWGGTLTLMGNNTFSGGLSIHGGTLVVQNVESLGAPTGSLSISSPGILRFSQSAIIPADRTLKVSDSEPQLAVDEGATVIVQTPITKVSSGTTTLIKGGAGTLVLESAATFDGATYVKQGNLQLRGTDNILPTGRNVTLNGSTLSLNSTSQTIAAITGSGSIEIVDSTLVTTNANNISATLSGNGVINIQGGGTFSASGDFGGVLNAQSGTLYLGALGLTSTVNVNTAANLRGYGTAGAINIGSGGKVDLTLVNSLDTLLETKSLSIAGGSHIVWGFSRANAPVGQGLSQIKVDGIASFTATTAQPVTISIITVSGYDAPGAAIVFDPNKNYQFPILTTTGGIQGFSPSSTILNTTGVVNAHTGTFTLALGNSGRDLILLYHANNYEGWLTERFTPDEITNLTISGPNADPDHDGYVNLLEYALGLEPKISNSSDQPTVALINNEWVYSYKRRANPTDVTIVVEHSSNLTTWTTSGVIHEKVSTQEGVETWQARVPAQNVTNAFFRLVGTRL